MDRRLLLTSLGVAIAGLGSGAAGLLVVRSRAPGGPELPQGERTLAVEQPAIEVLTGVPRTLALDIRTLTNQQVSGAPFEVYVRGTDGQLLGGPFPTSYERIGVDGLGVYLTTLALPDPGSFELLAVRGPDWGATTINVLRPADSSAPAPGQPATRVPTPTTADARGYDLLCTQEPQCGMHADSLDVALGVNRPVVLLFATPRYCVNAVCSPAVATLDRIRQTVGWPDTAFVHCEIYADREGTQLGDPVVAWGPPSEPCLFTIGRDGVVVDRLEGPQAPSLVRAMVDRLGRTV